MYAYAIRVNVKKVATDESYPVADDALLALINSAIEADAEYTIDPL